MVLFYYKCRNLIEQSESHVVIRLLRGFLLFGLLLSGGGRASCANTGSNVAQEVLDVDSLEGLGEEAGPVWLNVDLGGLQDGQDLLLR